MSEIAFDSAACYDCGAASFHRVNDGDR